MTLETRTGRIGTAFWLPALALYASGLFGIGVVLTGFLVWFSALAPVAALAAVLPGALITVFLSQVRKGQLGSAAIVGRLALAACVLAATVVGAALYQLAAGQTAHQDSGLGPVLGLGNRVPIFTLCLALQFAAVVGLWRALNEIGVWRMVSSRLVRHIPPQQAMLQGTPMAPRPRAARTRAVRKRPGTAPDWRRIQHTHGGTRLLGAARRYRAKPLSALPREAEESVRIVQGWSAGSASRGSGME